MTITSPLWRVDCMMIAQDLAETGNADRVETALKCHNSFADNNMGNDHGLPLPGRSGVVSLEHWLDLNA